MPARRQLAAEGDHREGVARIAEGGQQQAPPRSLAGAQTRSASVRSISTRPSSVGAIGVVISVPTPAAL